MRFIICAIFFLVSACIPPLDQEPTQVEYRITPHLNGFTVEIKHYPENHTSMVLPQNTAFHDYKPLAGTPNYPIRYFVLPKPRESANPDTIIHLNEGYFQTVGHGFLACVGRDTKNLKSIQITWNAPNDWQFAHSFQNQNFNASCRQLRDALYIGGNHPKLKIQKTWFGTLAFFEQSNLVDFEKILEKNMKRVQEFWNSDGEPLHLVSIRNIRNEKNYHGSAHFHSFQLALKPTITKLELDHLITHEYLHHWNPHKLNEVPQKDPVEHLDLLWFTEGFTEYYAYGLTQTEPETPPLKNVSLAELKRNYKHNTIYPLIPYIHGRKIAHWLDQRINQHSKKHLKNLMYELFERSKDPAFFLTRENILNVICQSDYIPCLEAWAVIQTHVIEGSNETLSF